MTIRCQRHLGYSMTTCICKQYEVYQAGDHIFESQNASYTCGPIAILNGLHFDHRPTGPAVHRQIMVACNPQVKHADDGFKGTKPADMDRVIRRFWPSAKKAIGPVACLSVLHVASRAILLYQRTPRLQHYIFVHRDEAGYHLENDEEGSVFVKEMSGYMKKEPMVWVL